MTIVMRPSCWHKKFGPNGLSAPAQVLCLNFFSSITVDFNIPSALRWAIQDQWSSGFMYNGHLLSTLLLLGIPISLYPPPPILPELSSSGLPCMFNFQPSNSWQTVLQSWVYFLSTAVLLSILSILLRLLMFYWVLSIFYWVLSISYCLFCPGLLGLTYPTYGLSNCYWLKPNKCPYVGKSVRDVSVFP